jgi:uncharacterized protein (DUF1697 family)
MYIAFLRGINVSGQKPVQMQMLKEMFENLGFTKVLTYIQSGNVIFESNITDEMALENTILAGILEKFGYEVAVMVRSLPDLEAIIQENPLQVPETERLYFTFLACLPDAERVGKLDTSKYLPDSFVLVGKMIYLRVESYGKTKLSNTFFETKLKVSATTRNFNTLQKIIELAKE